LVDGGVGAVGMVDEDVLPDPCPGLDCPPCPDDANTGIDMTSSSTTTDAKKRRRVTAMHRPKSVEN